ncbi:EamA/RhaT family transporter [Brachyspira aalborgi]|uniref:EamA/RhaT family transporter n=1 Tax=Brachyspira aalborgi TaxID=29522 RepID=A0A5C8E8E1_9SPIR|nr:DMT family transporter [Brachyspira aalborgi]TXJ33161.1 EamA/RhaT family transporter [Brachyspira aalborgi]
MFNILLVIIGSIVYGFLPIFVKNIIPYNYSSISIVFYRYLFTSIALFIIIIRKKSFKINKKQFIELFIFSVIGLGLTFYLLSQSLLYISAGLMNMIHFGYPVVVLILMTLIYKEKINLLKILSALSSIIGIFLLTKIAAIESFKGIIYALLTTITYGVYIIANKKSSFASLDTMVSLFYMSLIVSVVFFIAGILTNSLQLLNNIFVFYNFTAISILCTIFSLGLLLYGVKQLGSSLASILNMFEPTTTVIVSAFIYDEKLTVNIIIGSILIILSTVFMILSSNSNNK